MSGIKFKSVKRALEWLESLNTKEIVDVLRDYPGIPHIMKECTLACYLRETTGQDVSVGLNSIEVAGLGRFPLGQKLYSIRKGFDQGCYPELEQQDEG